MFVRCASRMRMVSGLLRKCPRSKFSTFTVEARQEALRVGGRILSRLPAGVAILIAAGPPTLVASCENSGGVMNEFQDVYDDRETDEVAIERKNLALRQAVLGETSNFVHPLQSRAWIWRTAYWLCRSVYLAVIWTPSALLYAASKLTGSATLRRLWVDLALWTIEASGCVLIKAAQWCSMRPDMIAADIVEKFQLLQDDNACHSMAHTRREIRESFGRELEEIFSDFDPVPIASGSIAQVHHARLRSDGREVAVKVRHPDVLKHTYVDMEILCFMLTSFQALSLTLATPFDRSGLMEHLRVQVDLRIEAKNLKLFSANFARESRTGIVVFPDVVEGLVSESVLVETWCHGQVVNKFFSRGWTQAGIDHTVMGSVSEAERERNARIARTIFDVYMKMFLRDNYIHGDLHGGNVLYHGQSQANTPRVGGQLSIIDVGLITSLPPDVQSPFANFIYAMAIGDADGLVDEILVVNENQDAFPLAHDKSDFREMVREVCQREMNGNSMRGPNGDPILAGNIMGAVLHGMHEYNVRLQKDFACAMWCMCIGEGLIKQLDPTFDIVGESSAYFARYSGSGLLRGFNVRKVVTKKVRTFWESVLEKVQEYFPNLGPSKKGDDGASY